MKNRIMIVEGDFSPQIKNVLRALYKFLKLTAGNYRNALYVKCEDGKEYMFVADAETRPLLFSFNLFYTLTGEYPQKNDMCGNLSAYAFKSIYREWLLWNSEEGECPVCSMYKKSEVSQQTNEKETKGILPVLWGRSEIAPRKCGL